MSLKTLSPFWLAILTAVGALFLALTFGVVPLMSRESKLKRELKRSVDELEAARKGTPSRADIRSWENYRAEAAHRYALVTSDYAQGSEGLSQWFPKLQTNADGYPAHDAFMSRHRDEVTELQVRISGKPYEVGIEGEDESGRKIMGFNWELLRPEDWEAVARSGPLEVKQVLRELQKRFWARHRLAAIILNGSVKVQRIVDFRFFKKLHATLGSAPWEQGSPKDTLILWQGVNAPPSGRPVDFQETELPNGLGKTLTFGFALDLPNREVPKVIREMLNPGNEAGAQERMLLNVIGAHVTIRSQNPPVVTYKYELGNDEDQARKKAAAMAENKADQVRSVLLAVTCQIIDFDPAKVRVFNEKPDKTNPR